MKTGELQRSNRSVVLMLCLTALVAASGWVVLPLPTLPATAATATGNSQFHTDQLLAYARSKPFDPLGHLALASSDTPVDAAGLLRQDAALGAAAALAPTDPDVLLLRGKHALHRADTMNGLRLLAQAQRQSQGNEAFEAMLPHLDTREGKSFFRELVSTDPDLAGRNLDSLCLRNANPTLLLPLAHSLASRRALQRATLNCVADKALVAGLGSAAQWLWISSFTQLPGRIPLVFNGEFSQQPKGDVFDWRLPTGGVYRSGFAATVASESTRSPTNRVLALRFGARPIQAPLVEHALALGAGRYRLSYEIRSSAAIATNNFVWTIRCAAGPAKPELGEPQSGSVIGVGWQSISASLKIPENCDGQMLTLGMATRLQALSGLDGTVWIDNVVIDATNLKQ